MSFTKEYSMRNVLIVSAVLFVLNFVFPTFVAGLLGFGAIYGVFKALTYMAKNAPGGYEEDDGVIEVRIVK